MKVIFLGPLPPPVNGFSNANAEVLARLQDSSQVTILDSAIRGSYILRWRVLALVIKFAFFLWNLLKHSFALATGAKSMYLGISGGSGQILDFFFIILARLRCLPIFIHHHSFAYINRPTRISRLCMLLLKQQTHVVLCEVMAQRLGGAYDIDTKRIVVVSNRALLEDPEVHLARNRRVGGLRFGFLSNITAEKGIFDFLQIVRDLEGLSISFEAVIAGPVDPAIHLDFYHEISKITSVSYIGPVYGAEKDAFYKGLDVLLFPTRYANEAEPLTLYEAQRFGVYVVAADRGCIASSVTPLAGMVVNIDSFHQTAVSVVRKFSLLGCDELSALRATIVAEYSCSAQIAKGELDILVKRVAGFQVGGSV